MMTDRDFEQWLSRLDAEQQNAPDDLDLDAELQRVVERGNEIRRQRATEYSAAVDAESDTSVVRPLRVGSPTPMRKFTAAMATAVAMICFVFVAASLVSDRSAPPYDMVADSFGIEVEFAPDTIEFRVDELEKEIKKRAGVISLGDYKLTVTASPGSRGKADMARVLAVERLNAVVAKLVSIGLARENISDRLVPDGPGGVLVRETVLAPGQIVTLPPPPPTVTVSKGSSLSNSTCGSSCNSVRISMRNFAPQTGYMISCTSGTQSAPAVFHTYTASTNDMGALDSEICFYGFNGGTVWAVVGGVVSNRVNW
jgi:hypothetical protein